uniref:Uncharacterized protein n=1 Tax=Arundo donax TaxID=35708 RepID=A0A0A9GZR6_ARUDO
MPTNSRFIITRCKFFCALLITGAQVHRRKLERRISQQNLPFTEAKASTCHPHRP